jgi:hypothetical protein
MDIGCEILAVGDVSLEDASHAEAVALLTAPRTAALRLALRRNRVLRSKYFEGPPLYSRILSSVVATTAFTMPMGNR